MKRFSHGWMLIFWVIYGGVFYALEWLVPPREYVAVWCPLDERIPFCEWFMIPYLFWFVYMVWAHGYTFFADPAAFRRLMKCIMLTFGTACVIFVVFPTCQELRPGVYPRDNTLSRLAAWFYTTDTSTNVFPSLHVCGSIAAGAALADTKRFGTPGWKWINFAIVTFISVSTVFVKQHSVLDVIGGIALSAPALWFTYRAKTGEKV